MLPLYERAARDSCSLICKGASPLAMRSWLISCAAANSSSLAVVEISATLPCPACTRCRCRQDPASCRSRTSIRSRGRSERVRSYPSRLRCLMPRSALVSATPPHSRYLVAQWPSSSQGPTRHIIDVNKEDLRPRTNAVSIAKPRRVALLAEDVHTRFDSRPIPRSFPISIDGEGDVRRDPNSSHRPPTPRRRWPQSDYRCHELLQEHDVDADRLIPHAT